MREFRPLYKLYLQGLFEFPKATQNLHNIIILMSREELPFKTLILQKEALFFSAQVSTNTTRETVGGLEMGLRKLLLHRMIF